MKNIPKIYFDEAGNTGANLLDPEQPFFVLASSNFSNEEAEELINLFQIQGDELHFVNLKKHEKYQKQLINFLNHDLISTEKVKYSLIEKRFTAIANIVDLLIEPVFYDSGIDIYQNGLNLAYSNILYIGGQNFWNKIEFDLMLLNFVKMMRNKTEESIKNFYSVLSNLYKSSTQDSRILLKPIIESKNQIKLILQATNKYSIDPCYPAFVTLCNLWYKELKEDFDIFHDTSKQIQFWQEMIKFVSDKFKMTEIEVGFDSRTMIFPLKINSLQLLDSKKNKKIQISDIIASSIMYALKESKKGNSSKFVTELLNCKLLNMFHHAIIPSTAVTPEQLDMTEGKGINTLDYLVAMAHKNKIEYDEIINRMK